MPALSSLRTPLRAAVLGAALGFTAIVASGCEPKDIPCTTSDECPYNGQICVSGLCRGGGATTDGGGGTGAVAGTGGQGGTAGQGGTGGFITEDAGTNTYDGGCGPINAGNPPYPRRCAPPTNSECAPAVDALLTAGGLSGPLLNGSTGNGFDDDCDGQVDEGCGCSGVGTTKDCYLVPATQANPANRQPVGWCASNAKGSLDCAGAGEFLFWSGVCRGARAPQRFDSCAQGDFDCDGLSGNNQTSGCACASTVQCPTNAIQLAPYPPTGAIPPIDGNQWITDPGQRGATSNWTWTVVGGDCDNVLPNPTYALYRTPNGTVTNQVGQRVTVRFDQGQGKYVTAANEPVAAVRAENFGNGTAGGLVHTAFALSGDYLVQGEFSLNGQRYTCTQKVEVRAPGIRAELCWDSVGNRDVDMHFARLQGVSCSDQGWRTTCGSFSSAQDCYFSNCAGSSNLDWMYMDSPTSACQGWGSKRTGTCNNPRLDRDNVSCSRTVTDPTSSNFCGPENTNIDNPRDQDRFVVGANFYGGSTNGPAKPHVNLYCNGRRVLSLGFNPATGQNSFPVLTSSGGSTGDFWTAAVIKANVTGGTLTSCDVTPVPSRSPDPTRDGPGNTNVCVDSSAVGAPFRYTSSKFVDTGSTQGVPAGSVPQTPQQWCKH